jgi:DNA-binding winged helix-turn-helix (wHTH) protein
VDVFIRKLRSKLAKRSPGWEYIHTHFGIGYRFDAKPVVGSEAEAPAREPSEPPVERPDTEVPEVDAPSPSGL